MVQSDCVHRSSLLQLGRNRPVRYDLQLYWTRNLCDVWDVSIQHVVGTPSPKLGYEPRKKHGLEGEIYAPASSRLFQHLQSPQFRYSECKYNQYIHGRNDYVDRFRLAEPQN